MSPEVCRAALQPLDQDGQKRPLEDGEADADKDVVEVSGTAPSKRRSSSGSAMGSSSGGLGAQTPITHLLHTHVLRHTEAQDAISSFLFECGHPLKRHEASILVQDVGGREEGRSFLFPSCNTFFSLSDPVRFPLARLFSHYLSVPYKSSLDLFLQRFSSRAYFCRALTEKKKCVGSDKRFLHQLREKGLSWEGKGH